jgi:Cu-Zn family superoxide dismutase
MRGLILAAALSLVGAGAAVAAGVNADLSIATLQGPGAAVGSVRIEAGPGGGALIHYDLHGLPPGPHGFHIHAQGSCAPAPGKDGATVVAGAAGGHFDPANSGAHRGPEGEGHMGDLPRITVGPDGTARGDALAPHIQDIDALAGKALMIHAGGDNYSDTPAPLGGGGARLACGVLRPS